MNEKNLKTIITDLKNEVKNSWLQTKDLPYEEIQKIKDLRFVVTLNKLLFVALNSIEYGDDTSFLDTLIALSQIYELSSREDLGYNGPIKEWFKDNSGNRVRAKTHLSCSVPSKEVYMRFIILATFAAKATAYKFIRYLCEQKVEIKNNRGLTKEFILFHPFYNYNSGEGTLISLYDETREVINNNKVLYEKYFEGNPETLITYQSEADFLIELYYFVNNIHRGRGRFLNFPRFHIERFCQLFDRIFKYPEDLKEFTKYTKDQIFAMCTYIKNFSAKNLFAYCSDWNTEDVVGDLKNKYSQIEL